MNVVNFHKKEKKQQVFEIISDAILKMVGDASKALEISEQIMADIEEIKPFDPSTIVRQKNECKHENISKTIKTNTYPYGWDVEEVECLDCSKIISLKVLH